MLMTLSRRQWLGSSAALLATATNGRTSCGDDEAKAEPIGPVFRLRFLADVHEQPYSGRVYLFLSKGQRDPRFGPDWFRPEPFLSRNVTDLKPGDVIELRIGDGVSEAFPPEIANLDLTGYRAQAVVRFNTWERNVGTGVGNGYSTPVAFDGKATDVVLDVDQLVAARPFPKSKWSREFVVPSPLLSDFYQSPVSIKCCVVLPASWYDQPTTKYPVLFNIPGFGGTHQMGFRPEPIKEENEKGIEFIRVMLDPSCPLGHHVFADSANNGPWGTALVKEFLPAFEDEFRTIAEPSGRLLTGHSSGGWSSLWVQVNHPETFGGVWSTAPDPVDFRDFQQINLYRPFENMYVDPQGSRRPLARFGDKIALWYDRFCRMEDVLGTGGQMHSFEAVFSKRTDSGLPQQLWNRDTGEIDTDVAKSWEPYDISLKLKSEWPTLGPSLAGKLNIHMGEVDTFYLDGATRLLKQTLTDLSSDATAELHPGKDHMNLLDRALTTRMREEMIQTVLKGT